MESQEKHVYALPRFTNRERNDRNNLLSTGSLRIARGTFRNTPC